MHPKTTDHQIYILWDLFYLDKTLWVCFFPLLFTGHPCLKAFPSCVCVCVCLIQLGFNSIDFPSQAPVDAVFLSMQLLTLNETRTKRSVDCR